MNANGVGQVVSPANRKLTARLRSGTLKAAVRLRPETWQLLADLRRPLLDSEGNLVAFESFDRLVRRILEERRAQRTSQARPRGDRR